jgi:hypothetical protein
VLLSQLHSFLAEEAAVHTLHWGQDDSVDSPLAVLSGSVSMRNFLASSPALKPHRRLLETALAFTADAQLCPTTLIHGDARLGNALLHLKQSEQEPEPKQELHGVSSHYPIHHHSRLDQFQWGKWTLQSSCGLCRGRGNVLVALPGVCDAAAAAAAASSAAHWSIGRSQQLARHCWM